jgi:hypothetical protein
MKQQTRWVNALLIVALLMAWSGSNAVMAQTPVGAAFTYQGRLMTVSGLCDMSFMLYGEEFGGTQIGATQTITDVVMSDGYFSADPDFGAPAWNGDTRWLQVEATCPPGGSLMEFPRQVVRSVPYAMYALNSGAITSTVYVTSTVYYTPSYHLQGWETITGTPEIYTPTVHTQGWETITGAPGAYTPTAHTQDWTTITSQPSEYTPTLGAHTWIGLQTFNAGASAASGQFINALTDGPAGGIRAGSASDVLWYRASANTWGTPDSLIVDANVTSLISVKVKADSSHSGIALAPTTAEGDFTISLIPASLTANRNAVFPNNSIIVAGSPSALTSGRLPYVNANKLLEDSTNARLDSSGNAYFAGNVGVDGTTTMAILKSNSGTTGSLIQNATETIIASAPTGVYLVYTQSETGGNTAWSNIWQVAVGGNVTILNLNWVGGSQSDCVASGFNIQIKNLHPATVAIKWGYLRIL